MMYAAKKKYMELLHQLSPREAKFVVEYCNHDNATLAAKRAGYGSSGTESASTIGWRLLQKVEIAEAIQAGTDAYLEQCEFHEPSVIQRLVDVANSDLEHYEIDAHGNVCLTEGAPLTSLRAVQSINRTQTTHDDGSVTVRTTFRLWDKLKALELLGKKLKMWVDKIESDNPQDQVYRHMLEEIKKRQSAAN